MQVSLGGRALFEHPTDARTWTPPEIETPCRNYTTVKLHMCRFGLQLPDSANLIRKSTRLTRLLVTHEDMQVLGLTCPGKSDPQHVCHDVVQGSAPGVPSVNSFAGASPQGFVHAVLDTVPA